MRGVVPVWGESRWYEVCLYGIDLSMFGTVNAFTRSLPAARLMSEKTRS